MKTCTEQAAGMQALNPLRVINVGLATRTGSSIAGVGQYDVQTVAFQNFVDGNPVHPRGLHCYGSNPDIGQPLSHALKVSCERSERSHRLLSKVGWDRHNMEARSDIYAGCVVIDDR